MISSWLRDHDVKSNLPNDVEKLKDIIGEVVGHYHSLQNQNLLLQQQNTQLQQQVAELTHQVALLKQHRFGKKTEKIPPQGGSTGSGGGNFGGSPQRHPGRQALPAHLSRVRQEYDLEEQDKVCPLCQERLTKIQEVVSEQLDVIPAQLHVKEHVRFKYACKHCYGVIKTASLPRQAMDKGLPSAPLLAHVLTHKFADHLPFYRQQRWFERQRCLISRSTLWGWEKHCAMMLEPLRQCLKKELIAGHHLFGDDTSMPTLLKGYDKIKIGRMWVYTRPATPQHSGLTVYDYTLDRKGEHAQIFLKGFTGYLQVDAYAGFNPLFTSKNTEGNKVIEVGCMAHARRKFVEVTTVDPLSIAQEFLIMIQALYHIERIAREAGYTPEQIKALRRGRSKPLLKKMHQWLIKYQPRAAPKSRLGQAIGYALNHWRALTTFLEEGRLEIDNNRSERAIKPIVIGRKNYMFMGGPQGGTAAAIIYTLIESCKQNNIDPQAYLADVLERLPTHPHKRIQELLPHHWKPSPTL